MSSINLANTSNADSWNSIISCQFKPQVLSQYSITILADDYQKLSQLYLTEIEKRKDLEREISVLKTQTRLTPIPNQEQTNYTTNLGEDYSSHFQKKIYDLEAQVSSLKDERGELYKTQGKNAQRLLDLTEKIQTYEAKITSMEEDKKKLAAQIQKMADEGERNTVLLKEKDNSIQFFQDELATCHLELTKTDEKMKVLKQENSSLLQRWLKKMNEEADSMNLSNLLNSTFSGDKSNTVTDLGSKGAKISSQSLSNIDFDSSETYSDKESDNASISLLPIPERLKFEIRPHESEINSIHISEDGQRFATGSADKTLQIFSTQTGAQQMALKGALQGIMCVQFNPTGELVLGTSNDNSTRLWSLKTGRVKDTLTGHIGKVYSAKFSPNSYKVVSGSHDRTIKVWDLHRSLCTRTTFTFSSCNDVCVLDSEGMSVASGHLDHIVRIWDMKSGNCIKELSGVHSAQVTSLNITSDGSKLLTNSRDNTIKLIDLRNYGILQTYRHDDYRVGSNWSKSVISSNQQYVAAGSTDGNVYFWNAQSGELSGMIEHHNHPIATLSFHPNPTNIITVDKERNVAMWETPKSKIRY